jgi:hypothetical protein
MSTLLLVPEYVERHVSIVADGSEHRKQIQYGEYYTVSQYSRNHPRGQRTERSLLQ